MTKTIAFTTGLLVLTISVMAFILSYNALYNVALNNGIPRGLAALWPLLIDLSLVIFSLAIVRQKLYNYSTRYQWSLVLLFTGLTLAFNILHSQLTPIAISVAIVPPLALFLSFESLMTMLQQSVKVDTPSIKESVKPSVKPEAKSVKESVKPSVTLYTPDVRRKKIAKVLTVKPTVTPSELSTQYGVTRQTIYKDLALIKNGNGTHA